jgi:hypothetical protein
MPFNFRGVKMAWGFFKKIGQGLSKAYNFVKDKVVKPAWEKVIKPAVKFAAPIVSKVAKGIAPMLGPEYGGIAEGIGIGADVAGGIAGADMGYDSDDYGSYGGMGGAGTLQVPPQMYQGGIYQGGERRRSSRRG